MCFGLLQKKLVKLLTITFSICFVLFASAVLAQTKEPISSSSINSNSNATTEITPTNNNAETTSTIESTQTEVPQNQPNNKVQTKKNNLVERKAGLTLVIQTRLTNLTANLSNRLETIATRLQNISVRLDSRIQKLETEGQDTTSAKANLANAQTQINNARQTLYNIDNQVAEFVGSENPRAVWTSLKATYISAGNSLQSAHSSLKAAINDLKLAQPKSTSGDQKVTASSSTEVNQ